MKLKFKFSVNSILFFFILIGVLISIFGIFSIRHASVSHSSMASSFINNSILFMGIDVKKTNQIRGRNDINILFTIKSNYVEAQSFPRDTLVNIPGRGYWLINSAYPFLTSYGAARFLEKFTGKRIIGFYAININDVRTLGHHLPYQIPLLHRLLSKYDYLEDWIRHRHKLAFEVERQLRIQAFLGYVHRYVHRFHPVIPYKSLSYRLHKYSTITDMLPSQLETFLKILASYPIKWSIYPGQYSKRKFDTPLYKGEIYVWVVDSLNRIKENPFIFSLKHFFLRNKSIHFKIPIDPHSHNIVYTKFKYFNH